MPAIAEKLEDRRLLSASLASGVLTITGTDAVDVVKVVNKKNVITVTETSGVTTFDATQVQSIFVNSLGGDDRIRLDKARRSSVVDGGAGNDRIYGSSRDDTLLGGAGDDRISGGDGDDDIDGGAGDDFISGDNGNDTLSGGAGVNHVNGGFGFDTAELALDSFTGIENFPGMPTGFTPTGRATSFFRDRSLETNFFAGSLVIPVNEFGSVGAATPSSSSIFSQFPIGSTTINNPIVVGNPTIGSQQDLPIAVTGLEPPAIGSTTVSPYLSSQTAGNQVFFRPGVGIFIRSGNSVVQLTSIPNNVVR